MLKTQVQITINGDTRTVEIQARGADWQNGAIVAGQPFLARMGRGSARYPVTMRLYYLGTGAPWSGDRVTVTPDGARLGYGKSTTIHGVASVIVSWR